MERDFHVYDLDSSTLKNLCPTWWTVLTASLSAILKKYGTLMKLWGWAHDHVSDSDMKARIIGVQTKMQTFSFFYGLQLAIVVLSHSDNLSSSLQRAELCAVDAKRMPSFLSLFFEVYNQTGMQASIGPRSLDLL